VIDPNGDLAQQLAPGSVSGMPREHDEAAGVVAHAGLGRFVPVTDQDGGAIGCLAGDAMGAQGVVEILCAAQRGADAERFIEFADGVHDATAQEQCVRGGVAHNLTHARAARGGFGEACLEGLRTVTAEP